MCYMYVIFCNYIFLRSTKVNMIKIFVIIVFHIKYNKNVFFLSKTRCSTHVYYNYGTISLELFPLYCFFIICLKNYLLKMSTRCVSLLYHVVLYIQFVMNFAYFLQICDQFYMFCTKVLCSILLLMLVSHLRAYVFGSRKCHVMQ